MVEQQHQSWTWSFFCLQDYLMLQSCSFILVEEKILSFNHTYLIAAIGASLTLAFAFICNGNDSEIELFLNSLVWWVGELYCNAIAVFIHFQSALEVKIWSASWGNIVKKIHLKKIMFSINFGLSPSWCSCSIWSFKWRAWLENK